ncbi:MAG: MoaD/ThiS family protein [Bacteroidetes bacterium]|nr:MoaD/ThiS family protein [Bacteroidota bacterium]MCL5026793.1 MoaD/ThiS family protein [Chloroflexota bacterium]
MCEGEVEVWLYGKLRRFAGQSAPDAESVVRLSMAGPTTIGEALASIGIPAAETSNIFLNGELSGFTRSLKPGDRLGVFPDDMALLYKWYFRKEG